MQNIILNQTFYTERTVESTMRPEASKMALLWFKQGSVTELRIFHTRVVSNNTVCVNLIQELLTIFLWCLATRIMNFSHFIPWGVAQYLRNDVVVSPQTWGNSKHELICSAGIGYLLSQLPFVSLLLELCQIHLALPVNLFYSLIMSIIYTKASHLEFSRACFLNKLRITTLI